MSVWMCVYVCVCHTRVCIAIDDNECLAVAITYTVV